MFQQVVKLMLTALTPVLLTDMVLSEPHTSVLFLPKCVNIMIKVVHD